LSENPFRDAFKLKITEDCFGESYLQEIKRDVEKIPGVHEADYARDFVDGIAQNANKTYIVVSAIVLVFLIATLLLINNTIRLALDSQRYIIHTMQLVGATNAFVQAPFVKRGVIQGVIASVIAVISLLGLQQIASWQITGFEVIQNFEGMLILALILLILGPLLAVFSTISSVSRYLRTDLDDLF
ncbi:MAG: ABC transporter permease, partial [Spirosomataceae bacterium]